MPTIKVIRAKGVSVRVPSAMVLGRTIIQRGKLLRIASIHEEDLIEGSSLGDHDLNTFVCELQRSGLKVDVFSFAQRVPATDVQAFGKVELENVAAIQITTYAEWLQVGVEYSVRKAIRRAEKLGVKVMLCAFDDELISGIKQIFDNTPIRQGKGFWHYGKSNEAIRSELGNYLDRSWFIGAFYEDVLIGFMKVTRVGCSLTITQILSHEQYFDKRPNNAMLAKCVQLCEAENIDYLIYGSFVYFDRNSSLTEFKHRHGFKQIDLPRYYVPLTVFGRLAITLGAHRGAARLMPESAFRLFLRVRRLWYNIISSRRNRGSAVSLSR